MVKEKIFRERSRYPKNKKKKKQITFLKLKTIISENRILLHGH